MRCDASVFIILFLQDNDLSSGSNVRPDHAVGSNLELQSYLMSECSSCEFKEMLGDYERYIFISFNLFC